MRAAQQAVGQPAWKGTTQGDRTPAKDRLLQGNSLSIVLSECTPEPAHCTEMKRSLLLRPLQLALLLRC